MRKIVLNGRISYDWDSFMRPPKVSLSAALAAGIICFLVYLKAVTCGFILWDDTDFVVNNAAIRHLDSNLFVWSFTTVAPFSGIWIPLTWLSLALDYLFWGLNPFGYHLTNIFLHSANVMLLVLIAGDLCESTFIEKKTPKWLIVLTLVLVGLFFGIHPLRVESVAWVTERKDVLNGVFSFGAIFFYLRYVKGRSLRRSSARCYLLSLTCLLFSLMAKPVSVVLPLMLLLADWYLGRIDKDSLKAILLEKIPFFLVPTAVTLFTMHIASDKNGLLVNMSDFPLLERMAASGNAVFQYLRLSLLPVGIIPYVPLPNPIPVTYVACSSLIVVLVLAVLGSRNRIVISSTVCFLLPLIPTLAFFQNNDHAYAARYTYLPMAIPSIAIVVGVMLGCSRLTKNRGLVTKGLIAVVAVFVFVFFGFMTEKLIGTWKDTGAFWSRIIEVSPRGRAFQERGMYYYWKGEYLLAIEDLNKAIEIAHAAGMYERYNLNAFRGEAYRKVQRYSEAVQDFTFAISKAPRPAYFYHRGLALKELGRIGEAKEDHVRAGADTGPIEWY